MKYISLFAGIGGFDLALQRLGHECVYANDFDKYCKITYDKNFHLGGLLTNEAKDLREELPDVEIGQTRTKSYDYKRNGLDTRSITDVRTSELPDCDLLVGGFPCQSFSVAGKRRGFDDTRGTMFFEIARILADKRPRYFILENVKGLLSHDSGKTFSTILGVLTDLGYEYQWQVLNSKNFGVPQNRERVFIVGHLRGEPRPKVFPIRSDDKEDSRSEQMEKDSYSETVSTRTESTAGGQQFVQRIPLKFLDRNQRNIEGDYSYTVDGLNTGGVALYDVSYPSRIRKYTEIAPSIRDYGSGGNKMPMVQAIRRLTPLECERLQGFPDNWTQGVSDTQRYKQCGNAVTVNVVYEVAKGISE